PKEWWLYILATVPIRLFLFVPPGTHLWFLFAAFASDSLKALLPAWLLRRASRDRTWFHSLHEFNSYFLVAVVLAPALSAFAGGASYSALGQSFWTSWTICFFGAALASVVLAPFLLLILNYKPYVEVFLAAAGLTLTAYIAFRTDPFHLQSHEAGLLSMQLALFFASVPFMFVAVIASQQRRKLRESEERFRSLVDVGPVMLWMSGTDARCTFFNKPWLDFTGLSLKEQVEQDWVARVHPEDRERCVNKYLSAFKSRENFTLEYRLLRNDIVWRWVLHNGVPRYAGDGAFLGYSGSRGDFTDRREAEEHWREVSTQLLHAQEMERCRIGHELHEDLAQKLFALSVDLSRFSREYDDGNGNLAAGLDELQQQLRDVSRDVVRLSQQ